MTLAVGEKVHIVTRRQFDSDLRRHFAGVVEEVDGTIFRVRGYAFIYDQAAGEFTRREPGRTRVFGMEQAGFIINVLPESVDIERLRYTTDASGNRSVSDGQGFTMNISEFGASR